MLGAIAGDIIGSRFEGDAEPPDGFVLFHPHCRFTDDSVCTIAVADALMGGRDFAASLRSFVRRHPRRGYGASFLQWALTDDAPAYGSWANGAPMRTSAVGWLEEEEEAVLASAAAQSSVSHDHADAIAAAQAVSLAIFLLRKGRDTAAVRARIAGQFSYDLSPENALARRGFDITAAGTAASAIAAAFESTDWEAAVRKAIARGGDTDTLACIAGSVAEAMHGIPADIAAGARLYLTEDLAVVVDRFEAAVAVR